MASVLSVDPGVNHIGWARHEGGKLTHCDLSQTWVDLVYTSEDIIVIEKPQVYAPKHWKGDPNDLINVAIVAGEIGGYYGGHDYDVHYVLPATWKGQTPKEVTKNQIDKELDMDEMKVLKQALMKHPKGLRHNIYDAVGIGRWYAKNH